MTALITTVLLGALISILGIMNMKGNISSLHWYHRQRVIEQDRKPFGRLVGSGTLTVGIALIVYGILFFAFEQTRAELFLWLGTAALIAGIVIGLGISFYGMLKYNKGIF